jgi:hypothetical protein
MQENGPGGLLSIPPSGLLQGIKSGLDAKIRNSFHPFILE